MNFIDRIKKLFRNKQEVVQETSTTLSLYDVSDIILPKYNSLNNEDKEKVLMYQNKININKLDDIFKYNQATAKEGERLSNLLIKYLYELNEIIRKDNKSEEELQEIDIDTIIKNMKIVVIKERLEELLHNSYLKTLSIQRYKEQYLKNEHRFIEIFSRAAKIKKNMELKSLNEAETRNKITIKTIIQQLGAINNAINANDILIDKINIYNNLINNIEKDSIRKEIYNKKIENLTEITNNLGWEFSKLSELKDLENVELTKENEINIIKLLAIIEVEKEKYILDNKDKMISYYINKILELKDIIITHENKNNVLEEAEKLITISKVFNEYIGDIYKEDPYIIIFNVLTFYINKKTDINSSIPLYIYESDEEINHFIKIIFDKINNINQGISPVAKQLQQTGNLKKMIKLLNPYFKTADGKYRYKDILYKRELLALILAFDNKEKFYAFFNEYKLLSHYNVTLPWQNFEWDKYLPLKTIYTLYEIDGKEKPIFYDIYNLYYKKVLGKAPDIEDNYYFLPEGLRSIYCNYNNTDVEDNIIDYIRSKSDNKIVVFPSSLENISGDIFDNVEIKDIILNKQLEYIGNDVFKNQKFTKISFPSSVIIIEDTSFNLKKIEEIEFQDFKNSILLKRIFSRTPEGARMMHMLFSGSDWKLLNNNNTIIKPNINKIILFNKKTGQTELTYNELFKAINDARKSYSHFDDSVRIGLSKLIEEKTGINIEEYQEQSNKIK